MRRRLRDCRAVRRFVRFLCLTPWGGKKLSHSLVGKKLSHSLVEKKIVSLPGGKNCLTLWWKKVVSLPGRKKCCFVVASIKDTQADQLSSLEIRDTTIT